MSSPKRMVGDTMDNELQHHGILGMKWGVRRYQNEDGTLTKAGKKRYSDTGESDSSTASAHEDYISAHSGKKMSEYSTNELQAVVNRLNLEKQYKQLTNTQTDRGKKMVSNILGGVGGVLGAATPVIAVLGKRSGKDTSEIAAVTGLAAAIATGVSKLIGSGGSDSSGMSNIGTNAANVLRGKEERKG